MKNIGEKRNELKKLLLNTVTELKTDFFNQVQGELPNDIRMREETKKLECKRGSTFEGKLFIVSLVILSFVLL